MLMDPSQPRLDALSARSGGQPNPFVVGRSEYQKFLKLMDGCTRMIWSGESSNIPPRGEWRCLVTRGVSS